MMGRSLLDSAWKASQERALTVKAAACRPGCDGLSERTSVGGMSSDGHQHGGGWTTGYRRRCQESWTCSVLRGG